MDKILKPILGKGDETVKVADSRLSVALFSGVALIAASIFTRKRCEAGEEPILKVLF